MNESILIIYNPISGTKSSEGMISKLIDFYKSNNINYYLLKTEYQNHAQVFCKNNNLKKYKDIIVCGGDGTFNEVINGLMLNGSSVLPRLGFLPGGTGNSFMHDLNAVSHQEALSKIFKNRSDYLDILKLTSGKNELYSFNIVGWGLVTDILILAEKMRFLKSIRYNIASLFYIFTAKSRKIKLLVDENIVLNNDYLFILICNTIHTGKGMKAAPKAKFNDGLLDIISVNSKISFLQLIKLFIQIFSGKHINSKFVNYSTAKKVQLEPVDNEILNIDGDAKGYTPVKIEVLEKRLKIIN